VAARVLYWILVTPHYVPQSDARQYSELAHNLATGRGFDLVYPQLALHATAFRPPVYPMLLGAVYWLTGSSLVAGRLLSLVLGVGVVALTIRVGQMVATPRAGLIAGLAVALYPPLLANDVVLLSEPVSLLLILGLVLALGRRRIALGGVLCGLLILSRPSAQGIAAVVVFWLLWQVGWKRALRFSLVVAVVILPWIARNWIQVGSPVLVTSNGFNLAATYSPAARQQHGFVDPVFDPRFGQFRLAQFDEAGWQRTLQKLAERSLEQHPSQAPAEVARNTAAMFELTPRVNRAAESWDGRNLSFRTWTLPLFYVVTGLGLVALVLRRRDRMVALMILMVGYFTLASLFFVAPPRLRAPFDLLCCIGFGIAVDAALRRWRSSHAEPVIDLRQSEPQLSA